jgi:phospholipid transport system substrate-binding protein
LAGIALSLVVVLFAGGPARAELDAARATAFILDGVVRTNELLKAHNLPREEIAARLRRVLHHGFDVPAIAAYVLGPAHARLSDQQRREYVREFENLIVHTFTERVRIAGPRVSDISDAVKVVSASPIAKDRMLVHSKINRTGASWVTIDWLLREQNGKISILDIVVLGISQAEVYRQEFASVMRREGGVDGLIAALRQKNVALASR